MKYNIIIVISIVFLGIVLFSFLGSVFKKNVETMENRILNPMPSDSRDLREGFESQIDVIQDTNSLNSLPATARPTAKATAKAKPTTSPTYDNYNHFTGNAVPTQFYGPHSTTQVKEHNGSYSLTEIDKDGGKTNAIMNPSATPTPTLVPITGTTPPPIYSPLPLPASPIGPPITTSPPMTTSPSPMATLAPFTTPPTSYTPSPTTPSPTVMTSPPVITTLPVNTNPPMLTPCATMPAATTTPAAPSCNQPSYGYPRQNPYLPQNVYPPTSPDQYILKTQIMPQAPVNNYIMPTPGVQTMQYMQQSCGKPKETYPPCPPCARCPEPNFECKKVPRYNQMDNDQMPMPVLNDFSGFGM